MLFLSFFAQVSRKDNCYGYSYEIEWVERGGFQEPGMVSVQYVKKK